MINLTYDLHIHSCLSPCGDMDMTPHNIAGMAHIKGLNIIALTDHNACRNVPAVMEAAGQYGITVVPGMELTTAEEAHVLCLFPDVEAALSFDTFVHDHLMKVKNKPEIFGEQIVMNAQDEPIASEEYLLINATDISFDEVEDVLSPYEGLMIPAHLDKETTSLISSLGCIPPTATFTCAEIKDPSKAESLLQAHPFLQSCRIITDSDAHYLQDIAEPVRTLSFDNPHPTAREVLELLQTVDT